MLERVSKQLVYLVYGGKVEYRQEAKYSILSALHHAQGNCPRILLYTDEPAQFSGWPVDVIALDATMLKEWTGPATYLHRRKAAAIRDALQYAEQSIFIDTDTFFLTSPLRLFERLAQAPWLVDEIEGLWREYREEAWHTVLSPYLAEHYNVDQQLLLINSGVLGFQRDGLSLMDQSLALIDELHPMVSDIQIIEQFAIGVAARYLERPAQAQGVVKHYFSDKEYWRRMIAAFFQQHGESFSLCLVGAVSEFPVVKPRPTWWHRLEFRLRSIFLSGRSRAYAKLAYHAALMDSDIYSEACALGCIDELKRKGVVLDGRLSSQPWIKVLNKRRRQRLDDLLEMSVGGR